MMLNDKERTEARRVAEVLLWVHKYADDVGSSRTPDLMLLAIANVNRGVTKRLERLARAYAGRR